MADRDQPALARDIRRLAESGDFEGFNAVVGAIERQNTFDAVAIDVVKRDAEFRDRITDTCRDAWQRKRRSP